MVRGESHIDFRKQSGGGGVITNDVLKFKKKISNFKARKFP